MAELYAPIIILRTETALVFALIATSTANSPQSSSSPPTPFSISQYLPVAFQQRSPINVRSGIVG